MSIVKTAQALATPLVIATSVITVLTGVLMFFHLDMGLNRLAHEWVSMLFALAIGLHVWRNWNALVRVLTSRAGRSLAILGLALAILSFIQIERRPDEPAFIRATHALLDAPLNKSLPAMGIDDDEFANVLRVNNLSFSSQDQTLRDVALKNGIHPFGLIDIVLNGSEGFQR